MGEVDKRVMSSPKGGKGVRRDSVDSTHELSRLSLLADKMFIALSHTVPLLVGCQRGEKGGGGGKGSGNYGVAEGR